MRFSAFGEAYCHTAAEVQKKIDEQDDEPYVPSPISPPEGEWPATVEIAQSGPGETICFIEAPTVEAVQKILDELGLTA